MTVALLVSFGIVALPPGEAPSAAASSDAAVGDTMTSTRGADNPTWYAYVERGGTLDYKFDVTYQRVNATDPNAVKFGVTVWDGAGNQVSAFNTPLNPYLDTTASLARSIPPVTASTGGVWKITAWAKDADENYTTGARIRWSIEPKVGGTYKPGRVWAESYRDWETFAVGMRRGSTNKTLYYLSDTGASYKVLYRNYMGGQSYFEADSLGVGGPDCLPTYKSQDLGPGSTVNYKTADDCPNATRYRIFFEPPDSTMPTSAQLGGSPTWLYRPYVSPTISNITYTRSASPKHGGPISFNLSGTSGTATVRIDADGDGNTMTSGGKDVVINTQARLGPNTVVWDGKDSAGATVPFYRSTRIRVDVDKVGEIHFLNRDVERRAGGIETTLLTGPASSVGSSKIYWDDTDLYGKQCWDTETQGNNGQDPGPSDPCVIPNPGSTNTYNGTAGTSSLGGVHSWESTDALTPNQGTWGNNRAIDDWAYQTDRVMAYIDVPATPTSPAISMTKSGTVTSDVNGDGRTNAGDKVTYTFDVVNTGDVALTGVNVVDFKLEDEGIPITCPAITLAPGKSTRCTTTTDAYTITQAEVNAGKVENTATARGTSEADGRMVTATSTYTLLTSSGAALTHTKKGVITTDANGDGLANVGDKITYTFDVRNSGDVTLTNVNITDPKLTAAGLTMACPKTTLQPNESTTCTASGTYTTVQSDVDARVLKNTATARGTTPSNATVSQDSTANLPVPTSASISLTKDGSYTTDANGDGRGSLSDRATYTFAVRNTGLVTLTSVALSDDKLTGAGITLSCPKTSLAPNEAMNCTASGPYTVRQADVDAGSLQNTATVTSKDPANTTISATSTKILPTVSSPKVGLVKYGTITTDTNGNGRGDVGDRITYSFAVTNTGDTTLTTVRVTDPKLSGLTISCPNTTLAPNESTTCTASGTYAVSQADVDAGKVDNTATVTATSTTGAGVSATSSRSIPTTAAPALSMVKSGTITTDSNGNGRGDVGDRVTYSFAVTNTGNLTVNTVRVADPKLSGITVTCPKTTLAPNETTTCTAASTYTVTQDDVNAGSLQNTATATATATNGAALSAQSSRTLPVSTGSSIDLTKSGSITTDTTSNGLADVGDRVTYSFSVRNTGVTTLTAVSVSDPKVTGVSCPKTTLAPNETMTCTAAAYTVRQSDVDGGSLQNTATATGTPPSGPAVTDTSSSSLPVPTDSSITIVKSGSYTTDANADGRGSVGDRATYTFAVTNTGSTSLTSVAVSDPKLSGAGIAISCPKTTLASQESMSCTAAPYTVTQADVNAGTLSNTATVTGQNPSGTSVTAQSTRTLPVRNAPAISVVKSGTLTTDANSNGQAEAGDRFSYTFAVTNTGDTTLNTVKVTDPLLSGITITCPKTTLAPNESTTCTAAAAYTIKQSDVDAGKVTNTATASGTPASGGAGVSATSSVTKNTFANPSLLLDKRATLTTDANGNGRGDTGDGITYAFTVTNTGNLTVSGVSVADPKLAGVPISCATTTLAPGQSTACTPASTYTVTSADIAAGKVLNEATAFATASNNQSLTSKDTAEIAVSQAAGIDLVKSATLTTDTNGNGRANVGDRITYSFTLRNVGDLPVNSAAVADPKLAGVPISCARTTVPAGESTACTPAATYTVTQADVNAGSVNNTATATAVAENGSSLSDTASATVPADTAAAIDLVKTATLSTDTDGDAKADVGDRVTYSFSVRNTGAVTLSTVRLSDPRLAGQTITCATTTLNAGQTATCSVPSPYTVTQADVNAGVLTNTATATANTPTGGTVQDTASASVPTPTDASIALLKRASFAFDANGDGRVSVSDRLTFTFTVTNTGSVTNNNISLSDPMLSGAGVTITCPKTSLASREEMTCTSTNYTVKQSDVDAGRVTNTATVTAVPAIGPSVSASSSTSTAAANNPAVDLVKTATLSTDANGDGRAGVGDRVSYSFVVRNVGDTSFKDVRVTDPKLSGATITCSPLSVAPGGTSSCTTPTTYTVTQSDVDAGRVTNTATVTATPTIGGPVTDTDTEIVQTPTGSAISLTKSGPITKDTNANGKADEGDQVTYSFRVTNTGALTISAVVVTDARLAAAGITISCPPTALPPSASLNCTTSGAYTVRAADTTGDLTNTAAASATASDGSTPTDTDTLTIPTNAVYGLTVVKAGSSAEGSSLSSGTAVTWTYQVTNVGNTTVTGVAVVDSKGVPVTCPRNVLAPGEFMACSGSGTV